MDNVVAQQSMATLNEGSGQRDSSELEHIINRYRSATERIEDSLNAIRHVNVVVFGNSANELEPENKPADANVGKPPASKVATLHTVADLQDELLRDLFSELELLGKL